MTDAPMKKNNGPYIFILELQIAFPFFIVISLEKQIITLLNHLPGMDNSLSCKNFLLRIKLFINLIEKRRIIYF